MTRGRALSTRDESLPLLVARETVGPSPHLQTCFLIEKGGIQDTCQEKEGRREIVRIGRKLGAASFPRAGSGAWISQAVR